MSQAFTMKLLKELGGRATVSEIRQLAQKQDPLSGYHNISSDLWALRKWRMVDFELKSKMWHVEE
jgi:hypothetical protein